MLDIVRKSLDLDESEVSLDSMLSADLDADSLDIVDIGYRVNKRFDAQLPLAQLRTRFEEANIPWLDDEGKVTAVGLGEVTAVIPEVEGRIAVGDRIDAVFLVLAVRDLVAMMARSLGAT